MKKGWEGGSEERKKGGERGEGEERKKEWGGG